MKSWQKHLLFFPFSTHLWFQLTSSATIIWSFPVVAVVHSSACRPRHSLNCKILWLKWKTNMQSKDCHLCLIIENMDISNVIFFSTKMFKLNLKQKWLNLKNSGVFFYNWSLVSSVLLCPPELSVFLKGLEKKSFFFLNIRRRDFFDKKI